MATKSATLACSSPYDNIVSTPILLCSCYFSYYVKCMLLHACICIPICKQIFFYIYFGFFFLSNLGDCWECGGKDYGWSILGTAPIGTVIFMIIAKVKSMFLNINQ